MRKRYSRPALVTLVRSLLRFITPSVRLYLRPVSQSLTRYYTPCIGVAGRIGKLFWLIGDSSHSERHLGALGHSSQRPCEGLEVLLPEPWDSIQVGDRCLWSKEHRLFFPYELHHSGRMRPATVLELLSHFGAKTVLILTALLCEKRVRGLWWLI